MSGFPTAGALGDAPSCSGEKVNFHNESSAEAEEISSEAFPLIDANVRACSRQLNPLV